MKNLLRDIFSNDAFSLNGQVSFKDQESQKLFLEALEAVQTEGRTVTVEGVSSVSMELESQDGNYPLESFRDIPYLVIGPSKEITNIPIIVNGIEKSIEFSRYITTEKIVLQSTVNSIIEYNIDFFKKENRLTLNCKLHFDCAKNIEDIVDAYSIAVALISKLSSIDDKQHTNDNAKPLNDMRSYFYHYGPFFQRLLAVEKELGVSFSPKEVGELSPEKQRDIDEIYLLLCCKRVVRLNGTLSSTNSTTIELARENNEFKVGKNVILAFLGTIEYELLGYTFSLYTSNLLINAVVKEIQKSEDGTVKVLYGDSDNAPMTIAYSAYKTKEEAEREVDNILHRESDYFSATTSIEQIKELSF